MTIEQLNYQLCKVFLAVFKTRSASQAATELGLSNSAVSRALASLRSMYDDPLFIRTQTGFNPTEKAADIAPRIVELVSLFRKIDKQHSKFDPFSSEGSFDIRAYDEFSYPTLKVIKERIQPKVPKMRFNLRVLSYNCIPELINGTVDFAVAYEGFGDERLNFECFAETGDIYLFARTGHPLLQKKNFSLEEVSEFPLLEIDNFSDVSCPLLVDLCEQKGLPMKVDIYTESLSSALRLLSESDCVTVVCNQFTRQFSQMVSGVSYIKLPMPIMRRVRKMRSVTRPIGNYLIYGNANRSQAFEWVKKELKEGLHEEWVKALQANESSDSGSSTK